MQSTSAKLLYVDDEELSCKYFEKIMRKHFSVAVATSLSDARHISKSQAFDFIISDYRFDNIDTDENGLDFLLECSASLKNTVMMLCSAYSQVEEPSKRKSIYFLPKPIDYVSLIKFINDAV